MLCMCFSLYKRIIIIKKCVKNISFVPINENPYKTKDRIDTHIIKKK